jgi:DNA-binding IclR family transcriptional regulator
MTSNNVERAAAILLRLGEAGSGGSILGEIAAAVEEKKPAVHRALSALSRHGFVEKVRHGHYRLGPAIYALARRESGTLARVERWRSVLTTLASEYGYCVYLVGRAGFDVVVLDLHLGRAPVQALTSGVGGRLAIGQGPGSIAIISAAEPDEQAAVIAANRRRLRSAGLDVKRVNEMVREAAERGYALDRGDFIAECGGISLPIRERGGAVDMAITIGAPLSFVVNTNIEDVAARMQALIQANC